MKSYLYKISLFALTSSVILSGCNGSDDNNSSMQTNMPPTAISIDLVTEADTPIMDSVQATDPDGDSLTYMVVTDPNLGMLTLQADGSFTYTPAAQQTGSDSFTYSVSDGKNGAVNATVNITIEAQQVVVSTYSRQAFEQQASDTPLPVNGREFTQDVQDPGAYDDLLVE
ncbi:Ig-like domain-containing protein [Neptunicella sp.]|uniref:Ig-like domain-containing protein n=1 Tax=Neptunicella sp. TaxID=2125986 RepID=UPI003F6908F4